MTDHEHKLIERGIDNEMLALLEWVRLNFIARGDLWWEAGTYHDDEQLLERFKNRNK